MDQLENAIRLIVRDEIARGVQTLAFALAVTKPQGCTDSVHELQKRRGRKPIFTPEERRAKAAAYQRMYRARRAAQNGAK